MGLSIIIPTKALTFKEQEEIDWINGIRDNCSDSYLRSLKGISGFGEHIAGRYYESLGFNYLHRFGVFGGNRIGTFPEGDEVLKRIFGEDFFISSRTLYASFPNIKFELPDLLIYTPDYSTVKFVEVKRGNTNDKLRESQARGLGLLALLLKCEVEIVEVYKESELRDVSDTEWNF